MTITDEAVALAHGAFYSQPAGTSGRDCMRAALQTYHAAEVEALRADAERYRWLRDDHGLAWEEEIDAAIDAARTATAQEGE